MTKRTGTFLLAGAIAATVLVVAVVRISRSGGQRAARANRLVAELRKAKVAIPTNLREARVGIRRPETIVADLAALGEPAAPVLVSTLKDPDPYMRRWAATALGKMGPPAADAVPDLVAMLADPDALAFAAAQTSLAEIGPAAVSPLLGEVTDAQRSAELRGRAATALVLMQPVPTEAFDALSQALVAADERHHAWAAHALARAGSDGAPLLADALEHRQRSTRLWAAIALKSMGPSAEAAGPALVKALSDRDREVAVTSAEALAAFGDEGVQLLIRACHDGDRTVRDRAVWGLGVTSPGDREQVVPTLLGALEDEDAAVRQTAAWALRSITGQDFGVDHKRWLDWWRRERDAVPRRE